MFTYGILRRGPYPNDNSVFVRQALATSRATKRFQIQLAGACIYGPTTFVIKLALFVLLYQLFWVLPWLRYLIQFGILSTMLFYFSAMVSIIALCVPRNGESYVEVLQVSEIMNSFFTLSDLNVAGTILK